MDNEHRKSSSKPQGIALIPLLTGFLFCFGCLLFRHSPDAPILGYYAYRTFNFIIVYGALSLALGVIVFSSKVEKMLSTLAVRIGRIGGVCAALLGAAGLMYLTTASTSMNNPTSFVASLSASLIGLSVLLTWTFPRRYPLKVHLGISVVFLILAVSERAVEWLSDHPDYPDIYQMPESSLYSEGGRLLPNFDDMVVGERGAVRFVTNSKGFRNDREFELQPAPDTFRVIYVGDSFVAGYRVGQEETSGKVLEDEINRHLASASLPWKRAEVMVASVEDPATEWFWLKQYGFAYRPNLVVMGVCLGNDPAQTYARLGSDGMFDLSETNPPTITLRDGVSFVGSGSDEINAICLPEFARTPLSEAPHALTRSRNLLRRSFWGQTLMGRSEIAIMSSYADRNFKPCVHAFDIHHALGFFLKPTMPPVETAFERTGQVLAGVNADARAAGSDFLAVLIPQRFQISERDWELACEFYAIDPAHFDLNQPNQTIAEDCARNGVACFDLKDVFTRAMQNRDEPLYLPAGDMHWNAEGHRLAGETMAREIIEQMTASRTQP